MPTYRILAGCHREKGKTYKQGELITTNVDLLKFNAHGMRPKFEKLENAPVSVAPSEQAIATATQDDLETLESMTISDLRAWAETEEIDLGNAKSKDQILAVIRKSIR